MSLTASPGVTLVPRLLTVEVVPDMHEGALLWRVTPVWADVDRPRTRSWVVEGCALADRLADAFRAGKAFRGAEVVEDLLGRTYVLCEYLFSSGSVEGDLAALGC